MNMIKQALMLWKSDKRQSGTTLQRRLILFFISLAVVLILTFAVLLMIFGINGKEEKTVHTYFNNEIAHISGAVYDDFGLLSVDGISMANTISADCDSFFREQGITAAQLEQNPALLEPLLSEQMPVLINIMNVHSCGGAFILLDATVRPEAEDAENSKAGIFLIKTQPTSTQAVGVKNHYLRGPAGIAREYGIELLGQWAMEYDITDEQFFTEVMETARENETLPLSRLYYWTGRVILKGNSEAGFLLCVPLRSHDGTVFGVCGIEVSDRMFKQLYSPGAGSYDNVFAAVAPMEGNLLYTSRGMIAGNYYLTGNRMSEDLICSKGRDSFERFAGTEKNYCGVSAPLRLYPSGSPYESEGWSVSVLMPEELLSDAIRGSSGQLLVIVIALLLASIAASVWISRRYLRPVTKALDSIRQNSFDGTGDATYVEIADLFDFLAQKDREYEQERQQLAQRLDDAQTDADTAQAKLSRLEDQKRREVDPADYALFRANLEKLTPKEREIFDLYLDNCSAKKIMELLVINENTLKYHNRNIYSKLGVTSRKELLMYAALMKQERIGKT